MTLPRPLRTYKERLQRGELLTPAVSAERPLLPWQAVYAEWFADWLSNHGTRPPVPEQVEKASELAERPVSASALRRLHRRNQFVEYFNAMHLGALRKARSMLEARYERAVKVHFEAMERAHEDGEYRTIPAFTVPILDRIAPKKDGVAVATQVQITLSPRQVAALTDGASEEILDAEIIAAPERIEDA